MQTGDRPIRKHGGVGFIKLIAQKPGVGKFYVVFHDHGQEHPNAGNWLTRERIEEEWRPE
jgi:hypothetical protein